MGSRNAAVVSTETAAVDVASTGVVAGSSDEVAVGVNVMARKLSESGAVVVEAARVVTCVAGRVDDTTVDKVDVEESVTGISTGGVEETFAGAEVGKSAEATVVAGTGKVPTRGTGPRTVGAAAPTVGRTVGANGGTIVRRERVVAEGTVLATVGAGLGVVGAEVTEAGRVEIEAGPLGMLSRCPMTCTFFWRTSEWGTAD